MQQTPFTPNTLFHSVFAFDGGMNAGVDPLLLPNNQLAEAFNCTLRGNLVTHRAGYQQFTLDNDLPDAWFQGACFFKPDADVENPLPGICAAIGGYLYQITPGTGVSPTQAVAVTVNLSGDTLNATDGTLPRQAWLWQAERWLIWQDGVHNPWFYVGNNGVTEPARRSNATTPPYNTKVTAIQAGAPATPKVNDRITVTVTDALDPADYGQTVQLLDADGNDLGLFQVIDPNLSAI